MLFRSRLTRWYYPMRYYFPTMVLRRLTPAACCLVLLALAGCGQAPVATRAAGLSSSATAAAATAAPTVAPTPTPTPVPTPTPPPAPALSLAFGAGNVTVSVMGIATGSHQVHVHRDCTGNPNLHITTLGNVFVSSAGASSSGSQTFALPASLRGRGYALLVYPLGASQGPPSLCTGI